MPLETGKLSDSALQNGGPDLFFGTPHIAPDFGGPVDRPYAPFCDPAVANNLAVMLETTARTYGDAVAAEDETGAITYVELFRRVTALARAISNVKAKGPVGLLLGSDATYVAAVFACLLAGRLSVLLDEAVPAGRTLELLDETGAAVVLARAEVNRALGPTGCTHIDVEDALDVNSASSAPYSEALEMDAPAFVLCTSGSSGKPKLIAHSQRTMFHWARTTHNALHVDPNDRALSLSPFPTLGGFTALLSYPLAGASLQIMDIRRAGIGGLIAALTERPVTILRAAPSMLRTICKLPNAQEAFANLRIVQTYGEPLPGADVDALTKVIPNACFIRTTYGSTEASGLCWFVDPGRAEDGDKIPGGVLMPDTEAALISETGAACGLTEAGELVIRSRYNGLGEWAKTGLTVGRLPADPGAPELRIFATGDLARVDKDGVFFILGRIDRMLKINGLRVEPAEVEAALRRHPAVMRGEIVVDTQAKPPRLLGFVIPSPGAPADLEAALKGSLRTSLPSYMVPSKIFIMDDIPLLAGGKVDQVSLLQKAQAASSAPLLRVKR